MYAISSAIIEALKQIEIEPTAEDIADLFWLAMYITPIDDLSTVPEDVLDDYPIDYSELEFEDIEPSLPEEPSLSVPKITEPEVELYPPTGSDVSESKKITGLQQSTLSIVTTGVSALPHKLEIVRALRSLTHKIPSKTRFIFDEQASAAQIADVGVAALVYKPELERELNGILLVDSWSSMAVWHQTVQELTQIFVQLGAFRTLRTYQLTTDQEDFGVHIITKQSAPFGRHLNPAELIDKTGRTVVFVITDCVSPAWGNSKMAEHLDILGQAQHVTILNLLPASQWSQTVLSEAVPVYLSAKERHVPNGKFPDKFRDEFNDKFSVELPVWYLSNQPFQTVPFPMMSLEPALLQSWAGVFTGDTKTEIPGYYFLKTSRPPARKIPNEFTDKLWQHFRTTTSPTARQLAGYLAAVPLTLPVMRLVQRTMLPHSTQAHLAELLNSHLVRLSEHEASTHPNHLRWEFIEGAREKLLTTVLLGKVEQVLREVSSYIEAHSDQAYGFHSYLFAPDKTATTNSLVIDNHSLPFAKIAVTTLSHLGYEKLAKSLTQEISRSLDNEQNTETSISDSIVTVGEDTSPVSDTTIPEEQSLASPHPLQREYDNAVVYLENGRYYSAKQAFEALREKTEGEWLIKVEDNYREAREKLANQVRPLIAEAESFAKNSPNDLQGQRNLWDDILGIDRDNVTAEQSLSQLQDLENQQEIEIKIVEYQQGMKLALQKRSLPSLNRVFGNVTSLQKNNEIAALQQDIDDLVQEITRERERLRDQLGAASTLAVSGSQKEAYKQAQVYIDEGLEIIIDTSGELFGTADAEIESFRFYKKAQRIFLSSLKGLAQQHQDMAAGQKGENPLLALDTLQNAVRYLTGINEQGEDEGILQKEDRDELEASLILIQRSIQEVEERLGRFNRARDNVLKAQQPGTRPERQLQLYRETREIYAEYPEIDVYIDAAQDMQSAVEAGRLLDQMTISRHHMGEDRFKEAMAVLQMAQEDVANRIPHPKLDSDLQKRLGESSELEQLILDEQRDYKRMMAVLQEIDDLLQAYVENKSLDLLVSARTRLEQLTEKGNSHHEARDRQTRLIDLQGVDESWMQGQEAYRLGEWARAIEQLKKVVESKYLEENDEAVTLIYRAQAAEHVINARKEEGGRNWRATLDKCSEAQRLFNQYDVDEQTEHLSRECEQTLVRLKPLEAHDELVRHAIQQAQSWLTQAAKMVQARRSLLSKVEPVEQYQQAVDVLMEARQQDTTLDDELEETLREAQDAWRQTYVDGMRQARHLKDEIILEKAVQLGKDLDERSLLYEAEDKQIYQEVQEHYLELQYTQLKTYSGVDPALIEENRRIRLDIAPVKTNDLRAQYREAVEMRVLAQMTELRHTEGIEASYTYLQEMIVKPELYQSKKLLVEYMHLCWQLENWGEAQRQAESLEYRGAFADAKARSNMWHGLTNVAILLNDGGLEASRVEIRQLEAQIQANAPQLGAALAVEEQWLRGWRVDHLVALGREAAREEENIEAAQYYAQAFQLSPTDIRVKSGLRQIGGRLDANLRVYTEQAKNIRIRRSLEESIKSAKGLENILEVLLGVAAALQLERDTQEELTEGLERLQARLEPWQEVQAKLTQIQREIADALAYPSPLQRDEEGGWQFEKIDRQIKNIRRLTSTGDREILGLLNDQQEKIREFDDKARELNEGVRFLMQAIQDEAFDDVLISANQLLVLWDNYSVDGFQGIELLIRHRYPFLKRDVNRLSEHKKQASIQKRNLSAWQDWANQVEHHYRDVREKAYLLRLNKPMDDALDDLREEKKLKEISQLCLEVIHGSEEFEDALELHPDTDPSSAKAAQEKARVVAGWKTEVFKGSGADRGKAHTLLDKIDADVQALKDLLRKLKGAVRRLNAAADRVGKKSSLFSPKITSIPKTHFDIARKALRACEALDPNHEDVLEARYQIRELERKYLGP